MTAASVVPAMWLRVRWWLAVILVLGLQSGLVFWLGDRSPIITRPITHELAVFVVEDPASKLPALSDPLMFSPANPHGFSGPLWLNTPRLEYRFSDWTVPPSLLLLQTQQFGNAFSKSFQSNTAPTFAVAANPEPHLASPRLFLPDPPVAMQSTLQIEGELLRGRMISPIVLPDWPHNDILAPTVVEVMVDLDGNTVSARPVSKCGYADADKYALDVARALRYQSIRGNVPQQSPVAALNWGKLVFEWHTVMLPATNPPPQKP